MKNVFKVLGIVALAAVIGFSMVACNDEEDPVGTVIVKNMSSYSTDNGVPILLGDEDKEEIIAVIEDVANEGGIAKFDNVPVGVTLVIVIVDQSDLVFESDTFTIKEGQTLTFVYDGLTIELED